MPVVPVSAVTDAWNELNCGDDEALDAHVTRFRAEQPVLAGYLQAAEESIAEKDDRGLVFFYGLWAWRAFRLAGGADKEITEDMIEDAWDANEDDMRHLEAASDLRWLNQARGLTAEYRQMALLGAVTEAVMDPGLTDRPRTDDLSGIILMHAKTAIDVLDAT